MKQLVSRRMMRSSSACCVLPFDGARETLRPAALVSKQQECSLTSSKVISQKNGGAAPTRALELSGTHEKPCLAGQHISGRVTGIHSLSEGWLPTGDPARSRGFLRRAESNLSTGGGAAGWEFEEAALADRAAGQRALCSGRYRPHSRSAE